MWRDRARSGAIGRFVLPPYKTGQVYTGVCAVDFCRSWPVCGGLSTAITCKEMGPDGGRLYFDILQRIASGVDRLRGGKMFDPPPLLIPESDHFTQST